MQTGFENAALEKECVGVRGINRPKIFSYQLKASRICTLND